MDSYITKRDEYDNLVYFENATGFWWRKEFNAAGQLLKWEDSTGFWVKKTYDSNGKELTYENYLGIKR